MPAARAFPFVRDATPARTDVAQRSARLQSDSHFRAHAPRAHSGAAPHELPALRDNQN